MSVDLGAPSDQRLFHIADPADWSAAADAYQPAAFAEEGFVHLSAGHQVEATTARHYPGRSGLLLLELDPARFGADVRWEEASHGEAYPHLYRPVPTDAVVAVHDWPPEG